MGEVRGTGNARVEGTGFDFSVSGKRQNLTSRRSEGTERYVKLIENSPECTVHILTLIKENEALKVSYRTLVQTPEDLQHEGCPSFVQQYFNFLLSVGRGQ